MTKYEIMRETANRLGYPEYRFGQILNAIFGQKVKRYGDITTIPKALRDALTDKLGENVASFASVEHSVSGQADKTLFRFSDGGAAEAVALSYRKGWNSFCISSQCGCGCGCKFCATGGMGFKRNLSADEITDQLLYFLQNGKALDSVSFMGMGEPLLNPNTFSALSILTDPALFGLSQRRITVSTVGIPHGIRRMTAEFPSVNLAFSLHAPSDGLRRELMPITDKYGIWTVFDALDEHIERTNRRVFLAYVMLDGVNDNIAHAKELAVLINRRGRCKPLYRVDLIPYNKTEGGEFSPSGKARIAELLEVLKRSGICASVRTQFGSEINAACGQLAAGA